MNRMFLHSNFLLLLPTSNQWLKDLSSSIRSCECTAITALEVSHKVEYHQIIVELIYVMATCCPDISYMFIE